VREPHLLVVRPPQRERRSAQARLGSVLRREVDGGAVVGGERPAPAPPPPPDPNHTVRARARAYERGGRDQRVGALDVRGVVAVAVAAAAAVATATAHAATALLVAGRSHQAIKGAPRGGEGARRHERVEERGSGGGV